METVKQLIKPDENAQITAAILDGDLTVQCGICGLKTVIREFSVFSCYDDGYQPGPCGHVDRYVRDLVLDILDTMTLLKEKARQTLLDRWGINETIQDDH